MGTLDRVILTLYTLSLAILSFLTALYAVSPDWVPIVRWFEEARSGPNRLVLGLVGAAFFAVSVRLIFFAFARRGAGQAVVHETEVGEVRISLSAVESLVRRVARGIKGVRDVKAGVFLGPSGLVAEIRGTLSPDVSIPDVSAEMQSAVKAQVHRVVGVEVAEVRVRVESLATEPRRRLD
ncbi:alkaline shock response membrane anchor protein AmaP [Caldinitratiruptor microaerophilus]|uniref:Alkaline shock response membrane anchor protein AmaP n=1 Tax=Caldinitratiruptor microaerophilus TaxID=671077 RepID=A0AA35CIM8_9FIRM|nr:alkaline shock response membrane anchor protein AmaP [Caldinitratiruptor microaerophilus]BDG59880.1 hypothetical protein caldi_09700 [Caldinitratiruptor microaerophilus]